MRAGSDARRARLRLSRTRKAQTRVALACLVAALATRETRADELVPTGEPPPEAVIGTLPFDARTPPGRVMIDLAREGSRPFVMMLDTGASDSVLTVGMARSLGVSIRRTKSTPYQKATSLGRNLQFYVDTSTSDTASKTGFEYGLLGGWFLDDYVLEIDYPQRRVRFLDPKKFEVPKEVDAANERVVSFKRNGTRVLVDVDVDGKTLMTLLDTGAPMTLLLSGRIAKKAGIAMDSLPDFEGLGGVLGPIEAKVYETRSLHFAGFDFGATPLIVAPRGAYNQGGPTDSAVGHDILAHFTLRIDYPRRRLWLRRSDEPSSSVMKFPYGVASAGVESVDAAEP